MTAGPPEAHCIPSLPRLVPTTPSPPRGLQVLGAERGGPLLPKQRIEENTTPVTHWGCSLLHGDSGFIGRRGKWSPLGRLSPLRFPVRFQRVLS